jgi:hypothetical protein
MPQYKEKRLGEPHDPGQGKEQHQSGDHGQGQAELLGFGTLPFRQLAGQDRNKDDIVDTEDNLLGRSRLPGPAKTGGRKAIPFNDLLLLCQVLCK